MNCDVLLFAAGEGKRLRPLTENTPKPLLTVGNKALIQWNLELIERGGFSRVIVNAHYLAAQLEAFLKKLKTSLDIIIIREANLLNTGGTIKNVEPILKEKYLLTINSDTLYSPQFNLRDVLAAHINDKRNPLATMVLGGSEDVRYFGAIGVSEDGRVVQFRGEQLIKEKTSKSFIYSGISVMDIKTLAYMPSRGSSFCLCNDTYKELLREQRVISSYIYRGYWSNVGTVDALAGANDDFNAGLII
ncbi:MAG: NTP transferase domain-containing protein [Deltaproteobacteria bacterium]|nr:NTP transferase domain-containing protein [Deltaproteobacteria bacterium]